MSPNLFPQKSRAKLEKSVHFAPKSRLFYPFLPFFGLILGFESRLLRHGKAPPNGAPFHVAQKGKQLRNARSPRVRARRRKEESFSFRPARRRRCFQAKRRKSRLLRAEPIIIFNRARRQRRESRLLRQKGRKLNTCVLFYKLNTYLKRSF